MSRAVFLLVLFACASPEARPAAGSPESAAASPESAAAPSESPTAVADSVAAAEAVDDTAPRVKSPVPKDYQRAVEFLDNIKWPAEGAQGGFDLSKGHFDNPARTASYVSEHGLTLYDINDGKTTRVSRDTLERQLRNRAGRGFEMFVHLGHIYAQPYSQYSALSYRLLPKGIIVYVSSWYRLTFERENARLQLVRLNYLEQEGE